MVKWLTGAKMVDQTTHYVKSVVLRLVQKTMVDWQWLTRCPLPKLCTRGIHIITEILREFKKKDALVYLLIKLT